MHHQQLLLFLGIKLTKTMQFITIMGAFFPSSVNVGV